MPKVWLSFNTDSGEMEILNEEAWHGVPVEMNNSLYRQIRAAEKKHHAFQAKLSQWYIEAADGKLKRISEG